MESIFRKPLLPFLFGLHLRVIPSKRANKTRLPSLTFEEAHGLDESRIKLSVGAPRSLCGKVNPVIVT